METIDYIDAYFTQQLSAGERTMFEKRCEDDTDFAREVAFYITTRQSLREELLKQKQADWKTKETEEDLPFIHTLKKSFANRWVTYAAAACLVLAASVYLFEANPTPRKLAENYISNTYGTLSQSMSGDTDSLTLGMAAYNDKNYDRALELFKGVEKNNPANADAKKYTGLTYLQKEEYDNALQQFDALTNMKGLFSNPGDFLKAVTLLERNGAGDKEEAKKLLEKVITEKEEGFEKAAEWEKKL